jgi:hypothetical protein
MDGFQCLLWSRIVPWSRTIQQKNSTARWKPWWKLGVRWQNVLGYVKYTVLEYSVCIDLWQKSTVSIMHGFWNDRKSLIFWHKIGDGCTRRALHCDWPQYVLKIESRPNVLIKLRWFPIWPSGAGLWQSGCHRIFEFAGKLPSAMAYCQIENRHNFVKIFNTRLDFEPGSAYCSQFSGTSFDGGVHGDNFYPFILHRMQNAQTSKSIKENERLETAQKRLDVMTYAPACMQPTLHLSVLSNRRRVSGRLQFSSLPLSLYTIVWSTFVNYKIRPLLKLHLYI